MSEQQKVNRFWRVTITYKNDVVTTKDHDQLHLAKRHAKSIADNPGYVKTVDLTEWIPTLIDYYNFVE